MRLIFLGTVLLAASVFGEVRPVEVTGAPFPLTVAEWTPPARDFPITAFGAKTDGTAATAAIEGAVAAANAAGGGRVLVPAGEWITGAFRLKSDVALVLEKDAVLRFPDDPALVMRAPLKKDGFPTMTQWALIGAIGCTNVAIMGEGTIKSDVAYWHGNFLVDPKKGFPRPQLTTFKNCRNVRLEGFKVRGSPAWTLSLEICSDIVIRGVDCACTGPNVDGLDLSSCNRALVENCTLDQTDDCYTIKSGANERGRARGIPSQNIVIRNCRAIRGHTLLGIGSEVSGGIRNVFLTNCTVEEECWRFLLVKTNAKRGAFVENVAIENVRGKRASQAVLEVDMFYDGNPNKELTGKMDKRWVTRIANVSAKNVVCDWAKRAVVVNGDSALPPTGIVAENIRVGKVGRQLTSLHNAPDICLKDVREDGVSSRPEDLKAGDGALSSTSVRFPIEWNPRFSTSVPFEIALSTNKIFKSIGSANAVERSCRPRRSPFAIYAMTPAGTNSLDVTLLAGRTPDEVILRFAVPPKTMRLEGEFFPSPIELAPSHQVDNLFASIPVHESSSNWTETVDVPPDLAGNPIAIEATVENLSRLPQNAELRLYQTDAQGNTLPETAVDRRWMGHTHPANGKTRYFERGRIHPQAKKMRLWFGIRSTKAAFGHDGHPLADSQSAKVRFRASGVAVRPAAELPFPGLNGENFLPGVSGEAGDRALSLGGWDEKAFWFQTRSSASWAGGTQLRREEQLFYPTGAGTVEAWFKSSWTPPPVRAKRGVVIRNCPITLFQNYQSFRAKEYKAGKGAMMELSYSPETESLALSMLPTNGAPCVASAKVRLPSDVWFHLAVEWTPHDRASVYVDGIRKIELPIPGVAPTDVANQSIRIPNDEGGLEFFLGSSWQSARAKADSDLQHPFFQGSADLLRISSGARYGSSFNPSKDYVCDGRTRAFFSFDSSFDGLSGGGVGAIRGTTRSLGCGRLSRTVEANGHPQPYFPAKVLPENDPKKIYCLDHYRDLPTAADFEAMRRPFRISRSVVAGNPIEINWPTNAVQDYIEIANDGAIPLRFPVVLNEGEVDARSYGDIADSLGLDKLSPKERVNRIFGFVLGASDYFIQHSAKYSRGSDVPETVQYQAMEMLNGYCGFECGPLNNLAAKLFVCAGKCPATQLAGYGHEFEQVFYDGKNHVYDVSAQKFFPATDNETAASLGEGEDEAGVFSRMGNPPEHFVRKSTRDFWVGAVNLPSKIGVTLNPGERFRVWQVNDGRCNDLMSSSRTGVYRGYASPFRPEYDKICHADASKRFLQRVERIFPHYLNGFILFDGRPCADNPAFRSYGSNFVYSVDAGGYPIVAASYRVTLAAGGQTPSAGGQSPAAGGQSLLEISTDGGEIFRPLTSPADYQVRARLAYLIRVNVPIESVARFEASTEVQLNPRTYPGKMRSGRNRFILKCEGGQTPNLGGQTPKCEGGQTPNFGGQTPNVQAKVTWQGRVPTGKIKIPEAVSSGAIPGCENLFYAFDSSHNAAISLNFEGLSPSSVRGQTPGIERGQSPGMERGQSPEVEVLAGGMKAWYDGKKLHLSDISDRKPHFSFVKITCQGAEKTLTILSGKGVRLIRLLGTDPAKLGTDPVELGTDPGNLGTGPENLGTDHGELAPNAKRELKFEALPDGRYAILDLNCFPSHPGAVEGASLWLRWPGMKPFGCGFAKNLACNFKKAEFGRAGGWANWKWDYPLHPETAYPFLNLRVSRLPAADRLTVENRSEMTIGLGAVLIVPDPDIDLRAELIKFLCGLNSDPARIMDSAGVCPLTRRSVIGTDTHQ